MAQGKPLVLTGATRTPLGRLLVAQSPRGIIRVAFLDAEDRLGVLRALRRKFVLVSDQAFAARIGREIRRFLKGEAPALEAHPVDLSLVKGPFQRRVLECLRRVPQGAATTYGALAAAVGKPRAQRAVGNAMAHNPVPIFVPCHRVVRCDGSIGHYAGGVARKAELLRAEGFEIGPRGTIDMSEHVLSKDSDSWLASGKSPRNDTAAVRSRRRA
jgi:O-6-methylguanine DNA methyltransferase